MKLVEHPTMELDRDNTSRRAHVLRLISRIRWLAMAVALVAPGVAAGAQVELRGYGKVVATITPTRSEFICENEAKADILMGKLLADLFWDAGTKHVQKTAQAQGRNVTIHLFPPYGAIAVMRAKNRVVALGADSEAALGDALQTEAVLTTEVACAPAKPYPMYLDFYDLRAFKVGTLGLGQENQYANGLRMDFVNQFIPGGMMADVTKLRSVPAEGADWGRSVFDADIATCEKNHQMYSLNLGSGVWPLWLWNRHPQWVEQDSDRSPTYRNVSWWGGNPESYGLTVAQRLATSLKYLKDLLLRYKDREVIGGWQLYCGNYFYESYFMKYDNDHLGYSATGQEGFRAWLQGVRGLCLGDLGRRWYGDAAHFRNWSEVKLPESIDEFFGPLDSQYLQIRSNWFYRKADANQTVISQDTATGWIPMAEAPSRLQYLLPEAPAFWRVEFDAAPWLQDHAGQDVFLVCNINNPGWKKYRLWLNGKALGEFSSTVGPFRGPIVVKVTGALLSGVNKLGLSAPGGYIHGPAFLTATMPRAYPYLGKLQNARYVDMLEWQLAALNDLQVGAMEYARSLDPDRPFVVCATSTEVKDAQGDALTRLGGSMQDTGYECDYRPHDSRLGYAGGFYGSCEASGIAGIEQPATYAPILTRMLGWILFNGEGSHHLWRDPYCYFNVEKQTGWFTNNRRAIQLVGKCLPEKPDLALFESSRNSLLDPFFNRSMWNWNIGRGELTAARYDYVYVTQTMLAKGLADAYPVLFDTDTRFMGPETVAAIRAYVEKGGTFVALHGSGRHGILEPDTWPISDLSGFKVLNATEKERITFARNLPVFTGWVGKSFEGHDSDGAALDGKTAAPGTTVLARWADGTVAVGMRQLGKGRVIVLGSQFWRHEPTFYERFFTDLGVKRTATATDKEVYVRKLITKNGQQEWLVAMNQNTAAKTADVSFAVTQQPSEVVDMVSGAPVAFTYANGWTTIKAVALPGYGTRIFAVKRGSLAQGIGFWWFEKTKFWSRTPDTRTYPPPVPEVQTTLPFDTWKFLPDQDGSVGKTDAWTQPAFHAAAWRDLGNLAWNLKFDDLTSYAGVGLYRSQPFAVPPAWNGHKITLNMSGAGHWAGGCFQRVEIYLNGAKLNGFPQPNQKYDVTSHLQSAGNLLAIKLTGTAKLSGLHDSALWLQPEINLAPTLSLLGDWQAVLGDWITRRPVTLPGAVKAKYLTREITIPAVWSGQDVYFRFSRKPHMQNMVLVNGYPRMITDPTETAVNITPFVRFGAANTIMVWINSNAQEATETFDALEIGCEAK